MTAKPEYALEVRQLSKVFANDLLQKKRTVIDNLSIGFPRGKCTGLLGHNGAGKTSTIRTILGLFFPDSGEVLCEGAPINNKTRQHIGFMPETNKLPATLSCEELLWQHLRLFHVPSIPKKEYAARIEQKLQAVGLWEHRRQRISRLSKGMGRRLAWAQATIHQPSILILDEPTSGMDPMGRRQMLGWINDLKRDQQVTIILCTHELASVQDVCDGFHILKRGKLVYSTIQPPVSSGENQALASQMYRLHMSGCTDSQLDRMRVEQTLPAWQQYVKNGFAIHLGFAQYPDAARWLQAAIAQGFVILEFAQTTELDEANLLPYFDGGLI